MGMRKDFHASSGVLPKGPGPAGAFFIPPSPGNPKGSEAKP